GWIIGSSPVTTSYLAGRRANHFQSGRAIADRGCQSLRAKIFCFTEYSDYPILLPVPSHYEGRFAVVTKRGAGCGGREWHIDERAFLADGEAVWSWHLDAGVKLALRRAGDGGQKARAPGRSRSKP